MFGKFPQCDKPKGMKAELDTLYEFDVEIRETSASYKINGRLYASCSYSLGEVPKSGHLGFAVYGEDEEKLIKKIEVMQIKSCPVEIITASYGPCLVAEKVREMYSDDVRTFLPNNQTWGDTQPGVPKALTITYQVGSQLLTKKVNEHSGQSITLPEGGQRVYQVKSIASFAVGNAVAGLGKPPSFGINNHAIVNAVSQSSEMTIQQL